MPPRGVPGPYRPSDSPRDRGASESVSSACQDSVRCGIAPEHVIIGAAISQSNLTCCRVDDVCVRRIEGCTPKLLGTHAWNERREHVLTDKVPSEATIDQFRSDLGGEFGVHLSKLAPVRACVFMMGGMEAIVEQEKVHEPAFPTAGMIVARPRIRVNVLLVVEEHDGPQREEGRHEAGKCPNIQARSGPMQGYPQTEQERVASRPYKVLG